LLLWAIAWPLVLDLLADPTIIVTTWCIKWLMIFLTFSSLFRMILVLPFKPFVTLPLIPEVPSIYARVAHRLTMYLVYEVHVSYIIMPLLILIYAFAIYTTSSFLLSSSSPAHAASGSLADIKCRFGGYLFPLMDISKEQRTANYQVPGFLT
jgi:hypothetical protein